MASNQNLTVSLEKSVIRSARVLAAERNTSISKLVAEYIVAMVSDDAHYKLAKSKALAHLETGLRLGGEGSADRDTLYRQPMVTNE